MSEFASNILAIRYKCYFPVQHLSKDYGNFKSAILSNRYKCEADCRGHQWVLVEQLFIL